MITIRKSQMAVLDAAALDAFTSEMVPHCRGFASKRCSMIDDTQLKTAINHSINKAAFYGFTYPGPVRSFIELSLLFGAGFDTDPQYPWDEILQKSESMDQESISHQLYQKTVDYTDKVWGQNQAQFKKAYSRASQLIQSPPIILKGEVITGFRGILAVVYPEKVAYVGKNAINLMISGAMVKAGEQGLAETHQQLQFGLLSFIFGHNFTNDPYLPWISQSLTDPKLRDNSAWLSEIQMQAKSWLDEIIR